MSQKRNSRSTRATPDGIQLLQRTKAIGRIDEGMPLTYPRIAEKAKVSDKTVARFFRGEGVDRDSAIAIIKALGLHEKDVLPVEDSLVAESIERIKSEHTVRPERATELIKGLEIALHELKQSEEASLQAMEWLTANRKALAREAAEATLRKHFEKASFGGDADESDIEQFSNDIRKYLRLIYFCLEEGTWEIMDRAIQEARLPVNREVKLYTKALSFIQDQVINQNLSPEVAQEITLCLDYLIKILPIRF